MLSPEDEYDSIEDSTANLYQRINQYYTLQMNAIGPDEYAMIQQACHYPEDYDAHMQNLRDALQPEEETTKHISEFLVTYPEFCHPQYAQILDYAINVIETEPEKAKMAGMQALMQIQRDLEKENDYTSENIPEQSVSNIPEMIPFQLGHHVIEVPSHQDPLLVSLYSVCFMAFASRMALATSDATSTSILL